jgi:hypothetical protein
LKSISLAGFPRQTIAARQLFVAPAAAITTVFSISLRSNLLSFQLVEEGAWQHARLFGRDPLLQ